MSGPNVNVEISTSADPAALEKYRVELETTIAEFDRLAEAATQSGKAQEAAMLRAMSAAAKEKLGATDAAIKKLSAGELQDAKKAIDDIQKLSGLAAESTTHLGGALSDVGKATQATSLLLQAQRDLLSGSWTRAVVEAAKAMRLLWAAMGGEVLAVIAAAFAGTVAVVWKLHHIFRDTTLSAAELAKGMEDAGKKGEEAGAKLAAAAALDFSSAAQSAKQVTDELERALKAAEELRAANDKLTNENMAAELAGDKAARETELAKAGGDKEKSSAINLRHDRNELAIRNRYTAEAAKSDVQKQVDARSTAESRLQAAQQSDAKLQSAAAKASEQLRQARDTASGGLFRSDQEEADIRQWTLQDKIGTGKATQAESAEFVKLSRDQASRQQEEPTYSKAEKRFQRIVADPTRFSETEYQAAKQGLAAIAAIPKLQENQKEAAKKAAESATALAAEQAAHAAKMQVIDVEIQAAKRKQQNVSSSATSALAAQSQKEQDFDRERVRDQQQTYINRVEAYLKNHPELSRQQRDAYERGIGIAKNNIIAYGGDPRAVSPLDASRQQLETATVNEAARNRKSEELQARGRAMIESRVSGMAGQPSVVTAAYREQSTEALATAVSAVKEGTTVQLTKQLAEAITQRDTHLAAVLREAIALLKQSASQRVNDPRR